MPYTITVDEETNIVTVKYIGEVSFDDRLEAVESVCTLKNAGDEKKLLIDVTQIHNTMTEDEQELFGEYLAKRKELKKARVAVVSKIKSHNPNLTINSTAYLQGYNLVPFTSKKDAYMWLKGALV